MSKFILKSTSPILWSNYYSTCSWRVRIALALKQIKYTVNAVDLAKNEQNDEEYLKMNPMGVIPTLYIDGIVFTESIAILEYLEETRPSNPLLPTDSIERSKVRAFCQMISSGIQPIQSLRVRNKHSENPQERSQWVEHFILKGFTSLENILQKSSGQFCFGDTLTMADICLIPQVGNALRFQINLENFPNICRIFENTSKIPEFVEACPASQPDYQP